MEKLTYCETINDVLDLVTEVTGCEAFWDDSRWWTLGIKRDGITYGAQRPYLGGGMRGGIRTRAIDDEEAAFLKEALVTIESIINQDTEGMESWEQNTGVLL
ncbi:MAG: hypothetical protein MJZ20_02910 [Bacteroidaceae bacterium]|nr:hypothetical protein [Bacteroidaceae bacterium]